MKLCVVLCLVLVEIYSSISLKIPEETQHATCNVFTKDIEASAKATVTRKLKGVCSSSNNINVGFVRIYTMYFLGDLKKYFTQLQQNILFELEAIKSALGIVQSHKYKKLEFSKKSFTSNEEAANDFVEYLDDLDDGQHTVTHNKNEKILKKLNEEMSMYNDTIVESTEGDLYFYYWKITEINKLLKKTDIYVSSPNFSVLGHIVKINFYPNYLNTYIGIVLKPESNSFLKKHKIIFLGQTYTENQISSNILYSMGNDNIFTIEHAMLDQNFIEFIIF
ncbi:uncharacterized protein LOC115882057 [Sitophilus oryzae]|uniref:Uncharacterized protein LOC115882057 n=1 Tax=Sitophilus oryzae TaxID=7048 RepID=A0A6J2XYA7_SITOR|nr:uncharacterized protein LOC115882057 [Sitophilus oryzae]